MTAPLDLAGVEALGEQLGRDLPRGSVVWLEGPLGAGKTTLARAITRGRGMPDNASSPTFGLVHHYHGPRGPVYHVDCYRMRHPDEAADLDWETMLGSDLVLIEWPDRAGAWAPPPSHRVRLATRSDDTRVVGVS
ncbi:MAG: tRNA (adenosine(37)-N6)-threonylcarbamoyltransferase complex ATPase subunit type 1 TsaE [Gemmatimonadales bacterium]